MTSKSDIRGWLQNAPKDATHMFVVVDTFDYEDYPVYVTTTEDINQKASEYDGPNMQKIMECYDLKMDLESQLNQPRSFNGWTPSFAKYL